MSRPYTAPAIRRAVEALAYLAESPGPVRLSDIAREVDCGKSTMLGVMRTLEDVGWVVKDEAGVGYSVGEALLHLTRKAFGMREAAEIARPLLEKVAESCGESAFFGVLRERRIVIEACVEGAHEMSITARTGGSLPMFAGATAKVLLAGMPEEEARAVVHEGALPRYTNRTITDPEEFLGAVSKARDEGAATDDEEYLRGVRAVAAPVHRGEEAVGVMWVAGFSTRLTDVRMAAVREELVKAARVCSALLESNHRR